MIRQMSENVNHASMIYISLLWDVNAALTNLHVCFMATFFVHVLGARRLCFTGIT
jgi:hypothetical protein